MCKNMEVRHAQVFLGKDFVVLCIPAVSFFRETLVQKIFFAIFIFLTLAFNFITKKIFSKYFPSIFCFKII